MLKNIIFIVVIPFIILAVKGFGTMGFVICGGYLLFYFAYYHPEPSSNYVSQNPPVKKSSTTVATPLKVAPIVLKPKETPSKFSLSQNEFESEINQQLNIIKGSVTKIVWVGDSHRTHPWSLQPGGCTVVVLFKNKSCLGYDKVKRPDRYTLKIANDFLSNHYSNLHVDTLEQYINEIYLTSDSGVDLKKVWHSNMNQSPWSILEQYRTK
ncbi:hypothetical protein [Polaribacter glomeratus]|uniref:Uncharacterized protein n=1 Tax=Polaribacter glomeratus TaxID=102 RepID=A0A2S7WYM6_9FLAO|nr:hypothetical protein [Polaribacter glomeratus]PQJ82694.1 hypothetical protein BTO16_08945 [Polaribacter glomeratus]TXD63721.1 hypothetical protein ESX12_17080 [Polaribacter glomeratus]